MRQTITIELVKSPWIRQLKELAGSARHRMTTVAPYITSGGWNTVLKALSDPNAVDIRVCTSLNARAVSDGYLDLDVLAEACSSLPRFVLRHIPRLHAKVYVADSSRAIVTSGNLTMGSLKRNNECGVGISDATSVETIERDISEYMTLGALVSCDSLRRLAHLGAKINQKDLLDDEEIENAAHTGSILRFASCAAMIQILDTPYSCARLSIFSVPHTSARVKCSLSYRTFTQVYAMTKKTA